MKVDGKKSVYLSELTMKEGSKDIFEEFEKNTFFFSYPLDTGFCMKKVNGYN